MEVLNEKKIKEQVNQINDNENEDENNININSNNNVNNNTDENSGDDNNLENNENENANLIDINDEEIKNIALQNEIPNFNDIYKKISEKFKSFQALIKNEIDKINSNNDTNTPNYIYSTNVIESQLTIYSFFTQKFLEFLESQNEKDTFDLIKEIHDNIA